jgi:hypothetical protein
MIVSDARISVYERCTRQTSSKKTRVGQRGRHTDSEMAVRLVNRENVARGAVGGLVARFEVVVCHETLGGIDELAKRTRLRQYMLLKWMQNCGRGGWKW